MATELCFNSLYFTSVSKTFASFIALDLWHNCLQLSFSVVRYLCRLLQVRIHFFLGKSMTSIRLFFPLIHHFWQSILTSPFLPLPLSPSLSPYLCTIRWHSFLALPLFLWSFSFLSSSSLIGYNWSLNRKSHDDAENFLMFFLSFFLITWTPNVQKMTPTQVQSLSIKCGTLSTASASFCTQYYQGHMLFFEDFREKYFSSFIDKFRSCLFSYPWNAHTISISSLADFAENAPLFSNNSVISY